MALKGKPVAIGNTSTTIYTCPSGTEAAVHGLIFSNNTGGALTVDVLVYNQADNSTTTVATDLAVAGNSYITWSKPMNLNAGDSVRAVSSAASGLVCLYSVYEGSAAPVATGFTGRGVWSSGSTYAVNDIVTVVGIGTYLALQASTNQDPTTATAYWMFLEGISASALPAQGGNAGKYLTTDGTDASWGVVDVAGGATVTSGASANITLTAASPRVHKVSFSGASYSVILPSATSLNEGGALFVLENNGPNVFTVLTTNNLPVTSVSPGGLVQVYLADNSTADGTWQISLNTAQGAFATAASINVDTSISVNQADMIQIANDKFLCAYYSSADSTKLYLRVAQFSGGAFTLGTRTSITLTQAYSGGIRAPQHSMAKLEDDKAILFFWDMVSSSAGNIKASIITTSGTTVTVAGTQTMESTTNTEFWIAGDIAVMSSSNVVVAYSTYISGAWAQNIMPMTISGSSITFGSKSALTSGWPGIRVVRETSSLITTWTTNINSYWPATVTPYTVSGTTLTAGTGYTSLQWIPGTAWNQGPRMQYADSSILYVLHNQSGSANLNFLRYGRDSSSPPRWSYVSADGYVQTTASNNLAGTSYTMKLYSTSASENRIAVVNYVSAGLGGSGQALSFFVHNKTTNSLSQTSLSFLLGGETLNPLTYSDRGNPENALQINSAGDIYVGYRDFLTQNMSILKIGLASV